MNERRGTEMIRSWVSRQTVMPVLGAVCVFVYFLFAFFLRVDSSFWMGSDDVAKGVIAREFIRFFVLDGPFHSSLTWRFPGFYMCFPYVGQVPQYFSAVFLFLFSGLLGPLLAFRMTCAFFGAGILLCVFFVLRQLCSRTLALWTVFFLGTNSMFVEAVRHGFWREEIFQIFGLWLGVLCLLKGLKTDKYGWTALGMFVFGVTLWAKMMFLGYILGAAAGFTALYLAGYSVNRLSLPKVLICVFSFLAGCLPLLVYNLVIVKNETLTAMMAPVMKYQETGVTERLGWFLGNLLSRFDDVFCYSTTMLFRDDYGMHWFACSFAWCAVVWCLALVFWVPVNKTRRRFLVFIFSAYSVLLFLSAFIVLHYSPEHIIIVVPFFEIICAVFVVDVFERIKKPFIVFVLTVVIIIGWGYGHARYEHERYLSADSGRGYLWNDFLVRDMEVILADFSEKKVGNLFCIHDFGGPFKFFSPGLDIIECRDVGQGLESCETGVLGERPWFLFTNEPDVDKRQFRGQYSVALESEYNSRTDKYDKLYLYRAVKKQNLNG